MSKNVKSFFESGHVHRYINRPDFYNSIAREIRKHLPENYNITLLDVGCGDGGFIKALSREGVMGEYIGIDLSQSMLLAASSNLHNMEVTLLLADAFRIPLVEDMKFDVVHIDSVLHHLIGKTRSESNKLAEKLLQLLMNRLSKNGILIVEEVYYDSYLFSTITSFLVFYGLKMINKLGLNLSFTREIRPGLEVNFLHESQLVRMLNRHGKVSLLYREAWDLPLTYQAFLLKERGHITYSTRKSATFRDTQSR